MWKILNVPGANSATGLGPGLGTTQGTVRDAALGTAPGTARDATLGTAQGTARDTTSGIAQLGAVRDASSGAAPNMGFGAWLGLGLNASPMRGMMGGAFPKLDVRPGSPLGAAQNLIKGEVFPANIAPVITRDGAAVVKWGFPHWKGTGVIINACAETVFEKNMFRTPLLKQRCVIPSSGFYEWNRGSGKKNKAKYLLRRPGEHVLFMAGMLNVFRDSADNEYSAFVILTTSANESVAPIHDRMPLILAPDERSRWISDDGFMEYALHRICPELVPELVQ